MPIYKKIFFTTAIFFVGVLLLTFIYKNVGKKSGGRVQTGMAGSQKLSPAEGAPTVAPTVTVEPIVFTKEQLEQYYPVYKNPYVIHIRKVLNGYIDGSNIGMESPEDVIEKGELNGAIVGLSAFDKKYYESKFIVYMINDSVAGGKQVSIIFQDKPDKLFDVWVYKLSTGDYDLRAFWQDPKYPEEKMREIQIQYETLLNDKNYSI